MPKFVKGQSGNPNGRPTESDEFRDLARSKAPAMLEVLEKIALDEKAPRKTRIAAANVVIERAHGKAAQAITGADGTPLIPNEYSQLEVARRVAFLLMRGETSIPSTQSETRQ